MDPRTNRITGNLYSHQDALEFWGNYNFDHRLKVLQAKAEPTYKSKLKRIMNHLKKGINNG